MFTGPMRTLSLRLTPNSQLRVCFSTGTGLTFGSTQGTNEFQSS